MLPCRAMCNILHMYTRLVYKLAGRRAPRNINFVKCEQYNLWRKRLNWSRKVSEAFLSIFHGDFSIPHIALLAFQEFFAPVLCFGYKRHLLSLTFAREHSADKRSRGEIVRHERVLCHINRMAPTRGALSADSATNTNIQNLEKYFGRQSFSPI